MTQQEIDARYFTLGIPISGLKGVPCIVFELTKNIYKLTKICCFLDLLHSMFWIYVML